MNFDDCSQAESDDPEVVVINESDDSQVVIIPKPAEESSSRKPRQDENTRKEKAGDSMKNERSRGNIPNSTSSRPYLRSHSGSWKNLRKRRQSKVDKISATFPSDEPFQATLKTGVKEALKPTEERQQMELPKISDQTEKNQGSQGSSSLPSPAQSGRISRSIENVISKLDRRSMSVLPQIGKTPSEGTFYMIVDLRPVMI